MRLVHRASALVWLVLAAVRLPATGLDTPLAWANGLRAGFAPAAAALEADPALSAAAEAYAGELAAAGVLSHAGPVDGSGPLDRFLRAGGTAFTVGEILGAGPELAAIERAWEASPSHRKVVLDERYTHIGWGSAASGSQEVWVVMLARSAVVELLLSEMDGALRVTGRLGPAWAARPWLDAGSGEVAPSSWDLATRWFSYLVPLADGRARFLLGCRDQYGDREATDSVTWPRGTALPAGADRSSAPAPPP
jgi:hypothetical protein